jgi:hypothetical protein
LKISDIHSAQGLKFKLKFLLKTHERYLEDKPIHILKTSKGTEFDVKQGSQKTVDPCSTDKKTADYIEELLQKQEYGGFHCLFIFEGYNNDGIEVQAYTFNSVTELKLPLKIQVSEEVSKIYDNKLDIPKDEFVWDGFGCPAIFYLNYKDTKKKNGEFRLLSRNRFMKVQGMIASKIYYAKDKTYLPIDIYIAPSIEFVKETDSGGGNNEFTSAMSHVSKAATYFTRWEAYNELAKKELEKRAEDFGEITYSSFTSEVDSNGIKFKFFINEDISVDYKGSEVEIRIDDKHKIGVGEIEGISDNSLNTYKQDAESIVSVPDKGIIVLATSGDKTIIRRRDKAKERMLKKLSPIRLIVNLIEDGVSEYSSGSNWGDNKPITSKLKRNFEKAEKLNKEQEEALKLAIDTPDIALIQGPPGTGKTTVIKAIRERFRELFENDEKEKELRDQGYAARRPKILISSFQNEAVDNAVSDSLLGDLPANRIGKKDVRKQFQNSLIEWSIKVKDSLKSKVIDQSAFVFSEQKRELADEFFVYKKTGESIDKAIVLIKKYLRYAGIYPGIYSRELEKKVNAIIDEHKKHGQADDKEKEDLIIEKIKMQRLTKEAFADDGKDNALRLYFHLKNHKDISKNTIDNIYAVYNDDELKDGIFAKYVETVKELQVRFFPKEKIDLSNKAKIEECIFDLANAFANGYLLMTDDLEKKKSLIVAEFLQRFENEHADLVEKYSITTAATCQASLSLKSDYPEYDLVIVDEATRANPLDLFIPMSMGRKIIFVGDQKQLPHMLEPEILALFSKDPKYEKDLPMIEKPLFERLYDMFWKQARSKSIMLKSQYRMHPDICQFVSEQFYEGKMKCEITAADRPIPQELFNGKALAFTNIPINLGSESRGASKSRDIEVEILTEDIKKIFKFEPECKIGVITFYSAQVKLLKDSIEKAVLSKEQFERIEIGTVDAFQGKEFDYVLLSCVRSNSITKDDEEGLRNSVGFLAKQNRTCVAFSRAKKLLSVYGDAETLNKVPCFKSMHEICKNAGGYYREL